MLVITGPLDCVVEVSKDLREDRVWRESSHTKSISLVAVKSFEIRPERVLILDVVQCRIVAVAFIGIAEALLREPFSTCDCIGTVEE